MWLAPALALFYFVISCKWALELVIIAWQDQERVCLRTYYSRGCFVGIRSQSSCIGICLHAFDQEFVGLAQVPLQQGDAVFFLGPLDDNRLGILKYWKSPSKSFVFLT